MKFLAEVTNEYVESIFNYIDTLKELRLETGKNYNEELTEAQLILNNIYIVK